MQHVVPFLQQHIVLIAFLNLLLGQAGVPIPVAPTLLAGSAMLAHSPRGLAELIFLAVAGAVMGDCVLYFCGRRYGRHVLGRLCRLTFSPDFCVQRTETVLARFGGWILLFAKFVPGVSPVAVATTGVTKMAFFKFLLLDSAGKLLYVGVIVAIGLVFQNGVDAVISKFGELGELGGVFLIAAVALYMLGKWWRRRLFIRQLVMDRITVQEVRKLIEEGREILVLDVRPKEVREMEGTLPGALAAHAADQRSILENCRLDDEIVIYCDCPNEASAAIAAKHLKRAGFQKIRPLLGGFTAWVSAGYPVEHAGLVRDEAPQIPLPIASADGATAGESEALPSRL
jgi:membrane protein DedA with SNARE-associated domain/rhodanese-related sulfurtransferase